MRMRRQLEDFTLAIDSTFTKPFDGGFFDTLKLKVDANLTAVGGAAVEDQAARAIAEYELVQGERPLIRARLMDLFHLSYLMTGATRAAAAGSGGGASWGYSDLPFGFFMPGAGVDASQVRVHGRGRTASAFSAVHTTATAFAAGSAFKQSVEAPSAVPTLGHMRPYWLQQNALIETANGDQQHVLTFDRELWLAGFLCVAEDASATARTDGLVKRVRVDFKGAEMARSTWGELKDATVRTFKLPDQTGNGLSAGVPAGVVFIPTLEDRNTRQNRLMRVPRNTSFVLHLDSSATVEKEFTAVTPATGDKLTITPIAYEEVLTAAGAARAENSQGRSVAVSGGLSGIAALKARNRG